MSEPTDHQLMAAHRAGHPHAFADLVRRHHDRLWAVALRTICDPDEAADALQDALLSAYRRAETFRAESAVTTWLHRIVVNACIDRARRRQARPTASLDELAYDPPTPRDAIAERTTTVDIEQALAQLPVEQRAAVVLVDVEGYPVAEAAVLLDVPEGTVKSRCSRARARLAELLGVAGNESGGHGVQSTRDQEEGRT